MEDEKDYNRKNVNNIKRMLTVTFIIMCALPVLFCLYLTVKMNSLENKIDSLSTKLAATETDIASKEEQPDNLAELDQEAYDDLGKSTTDQNHTLMVEEGENMDEEPDITISGNDSMPTVSNGKKVYLTFDDGPSIYTGEILDILKENNVKATFFCVYNDDQSVWPYYSRIVEEGHTLGMHSYSHVYSTVYASRDSFVEDVTKIHDFLYEQTGVDCKFYRFPGGSSNTVSNVDIQELMEYLYSEDIAYYDWNALSGDAVDASLSAEQLNENIMGYVRNNPGDSIVLMHDLKNGYATVESLQDLIDTLQAEGYEICAIDENTKPVQHVRYVGTVTSKGE